MDNTNKIEKLIGEAERLIKKRKWWFSMVNYGEISEIYEKIGNLYKLEKKGEEAIKYLLLAMKYAEMENYNKHRICNLMVEISNLYKKLNEWENAEIYIDKASMIAAENGDFRKASMMQAEFGEYFEEIGENKRAIKAYKKSLEYDDKYNHSIKCLIKIGENKALKGKYGEAIKIYKEIINRGRKNCVVSYKIPEYCLGCVICYLCNDDIIGAKKIMDEVYDEYPKFIGIKEEMVCSEMIEAYKNFEDERYIKAIKEYDNYRRLDKCKMELMLRIKNHLKSVDTTLL